MIDDVLKLVVLSAEKQVVDLACSKVSFPGTKGNFTVLKNHRALISSLGQGKICYRTEGQEYEIEIKSGFVEVRENEVTACVEL